MSDSRAGGPRAVCSSHRFLSKFAQASGISSNAMKQSIALVAAWLLAISAVVGQPPETLPQTKPLTWEEADLSARLMDGAHRFVERKIAEAPSRRGQFWARDFSSPEAYAKSVQANRERFRTIIGAVDPRLPIRME